MTIPGLARDSDFSLEVLDDRFAVQRVRIREGRVGGANGAATPTFTLTPAHWLEGRVRLGESGPAAAGAKFLVISHSKPEVDPQGIRIGGRTDAEGRFRVNVPRCESHEVLVYPPEGSPFAFRRVVTAATAGREPGDRRHPAARGAGEGQGRGVALGPRGGRGHPRVPAAAGRQSELPEGSGRRARGLRADGRDRPGRLVPARRPARPGPPPGQGPRRPDTSPSRRADGEHRDRRAGRSAAVSRRPAGRGRAGRRGGRGDRHPAAREKSCAGASSTRRDGPRSTRGSSSGPA